MAPHPDFKAVEAAILRVRGRWPAGITAATRLREDLRLDDRDLRTVATDLARALGEQLPRDLILSCRSVADVLERLTAWREGRFDPGPR